MLKENKKPFLLSILYLKNLITYILFIILTISCSSKKEYDVVGVILDKFPDRNELSIHHNEIPNFMMAMTMNFKLASHLETSIFEIGDSVHFKLSIKDNNIYSDSFQIIGNVDINLDENDDNWMDDDEYPPLKVGEKFSDATFSNYDNKIVKLSDFKDEFLLVTFIFTRCPIPNMCPALIYKQKYISEKFEDYENLKVLTISFDYLFDTPKVLKEKFQTLKSNKKNWIFLSSYNHLNDLYLLTKQSTFSFWGVNKNDIGHNMRTILIGPDLKFLKYYDGSEWSVKDVENDIQNIMKLY